MYFQKREEYKANELNLYEKQKKKHAESMTLE